METLIQASYFIVGHLYCRPETNELPSNSKEGILWAGAAMVLATIVTFLAPQIIDTDQAATNVVLIISAIALGGGYAWWSGSVAITDMPQMIAMYNGMGGGAATYVLLSDVDASANSTNIATELGSDVAILGILGAIIGTISFSGSIIAWAKLDGRLNRSRLLPSSTSSQCVDSHCYCGFRY